MARKMEDARKRKRKKKKGRSNRKKKIKKKGKRIENTKIQQQLRAEVPLQREG